MRSSATKRWSVPLPAASGRARTNSSRPPESKGRSFSKIDKYFAAELAANADKLQTFRALLQLAEIFGSQLVAEGIETAEQLRIVRDLGVSYGQGCHLGRPAAVPADALAADARSVLHGADVAVFPNVARSSNRGITAARLMITAPALPASASHEDVVNRFAASPELHAIALVTDDRPVGLVDRQRLIAHYAKPYFKELFARKPVMLHANANPLTIDVHTGIEQLTSVLTSSDQRYLTEGFIITEGGRYRGLGTGEQLVRAVTEARIEAARHANPLTFLPGNIPITDHIDRLLASGREFVACYADLNHFKPYNDHYGYWRGDDMIRLVAKLASARCNPQRDFLGHVGGDDFILLFQSADWRERCEVLVADFNQAARALFDRSALDAGGIVAEDRQGVMRFHPCTTLCVGAVVVPAHCALLPEDVASAAATAKRQAKQLDVGVYLLPSLQ